MALQQPSLPAPRESTWPCRRSANKGEEMLLGNFHDEERTRAEREMYNANPLRDYESVATNLYYAMDIDSGVQAIAGSEQEAREQLKSICPGAVNVRCERIRIRRRRQPKPEAPKADEKKE